MRYVVSSVHTKQIANGLNIQTMLRVVEASSKEEAIGKYIIYAHEKFPEHSLFARPLILSIDEIQQKTEFLID